MPRHVGPAFALPQPQASPGCPVLPAGRTGNAGGRAVLHQPGTPTPSLPPLSRGAGPFPSGGSEDAAVVGVQEMSTFSGWENSFRLPLEQITTPWWLRTAQLAVGTGDQTSEGFTGLKPRRWWGCISPGVLGANPFRCLFLFLEAASFFGLQPLSPSSKCIAAPSAHTPPPSLRRWPSCLPHRGPWAPGQCRKLSPSQNPQLDLVCKVLFAT